MADPTVTPLFGVPVNPVAPVAALQPPGVVSAIPAAAAATGGPAAPPAHYVEQDGKHRGVAGVARDILGTLGDFLLTRLHMPAMYAPAQAQRKLSAAMQGMDSDPVAAIQRVEDVNPTFGAKLRDQYIDNQRLAATQASTAEARTAREAAARRVEQTGVIDRVARYMNGISSLAPEKRAEAYATARRLQMNSQTITGDPDLQRQLGELYPETYDENAVTAAIGQSVPVATQWGQALTRERIDNQDEQAGVRAAERTRHNEVTEGQGDARIGLSRDRAARAGATRPARVSNVMTYVGDDGYRYAERSNGQTVRSSRQVRPPATRAPQATEGMRRSINGVTYVIRNGRPVRE